jgi:alkylation response protein AidB-like acyl-CoA dehydrogenase
MNFALTNEQRQLRDSLSRLIRDRFSFGVGPVAGANFAEQDPGWRELVGLGIAAMWAPEDHGGFEAGAVDAYVVMRELGKGLVKQPVLSSALIGTTLLRLAPGAISNGSLIANIAAGKTVVATAWGEMLRSRSADLQKAALPAASHAGGSWKISGRIDIVRDAPVANLLVVVAVDNENQLGLYLVDKREPGFSERDFPLIDASLAGELRLEGVYATRVADGEAAAHALRAASRIGKAGACAQMVGSMQGAFDLAKEYLVTRTQFGKPLSANQVLRHRLAEMAVALECCESMALLAAIAVDEGGADSSTDLDSAKIFIGRHARFVCEQAIQLHGAIGMTEEYAVGHYLQSVLVAEQLFGSGEQLLAQRHEEIRRGGADQSAVDVSPARAAIGR